MDHIKRLRPSPAMIVAIVALVLSLGGTSYAAIVLPANSVGTTQIKRSAVTGAKVKNSSLTLSDISGASLSKMGRVAYADGPNVGVDTMGIATVATASLTVPKRGFVLVQGWACMNAVGDGTCHVYLVDETAGTGSTYNAVQARQRRGGRGLRLGRLPGPGRGAQLLRLCLQLCSGHRLGQDQRCVHPLQRDRRFDAVIQKARCPHGQRAAVSGERPGLGGRAGPAARAAGPS